MIKQTLLAAFTVILAGCATSPDAQRDILNSTKLCCRGYVDLPVSAQIETEQTIELSSDSPVFAFADGRSYFSALSLPARIRGRTLVLRAFGGSPTVTNKGGAHLYVLPAVTFLNASREPIATLYDTNPVPELYGWGGSASLVCRVQVPNAAAYAAIHTLPAKLGELYVGYVKSGGFTTVAGGTLISLGGGEAPLRAVFSSTGKILLSVAP